MTRDPAAKRLAQALAGTTVEQDVTRTRVAQGLPPRVQDKATLARVVTLLKAGAR